MPQGPERRSTEKDDARGRNVLQIGALRRPPPRRSAQSAAVAERGAHRIAVELRRVRARVQRETPCEFGSASVADGQGLVAAAPRGIERPRDNDSEPCRE